MRNVCVYVSEYIYERGEREREDLHQRINTSLRINFAHGRG